MKKLSNFKLQIAVTALWMLVASAIVALLLGGAKDVASCFCLALVGMLALIFWCVWDQRKLLMAALIPAVLALVFTAGLQNLHWGSFGSYGNNSWFVANALPLMLPMLWMVLTFATAGIASECTKARTGQVVLGATLSTSLWIWIEPVARAFDFWTYQSVPTPLVNYLYWFVFSLVVHALYLPFEEHCARSLRWHVYALLMLFFVVATWVMN
jgi:bisanhydrobacterioruberin hydratase